MSSLHAANARQRPNLWTYISFSSASSRRGSNSLPLSERMEDDVYEKPGHTRRRSVTNPVDSYPTRWETQKPKLIKYGAILTAVFFVLWLIAPRSQSSGMPRLVKAPQYQH
jgi:hypothetical protein